MHGECEDGGQEGAEKEGQEDQKYYVCLCVLIIREPNQFWNKYSSPFF